MTLSRRALVALSVLAVPALASCSGDPTGAAEDKGDAQSFHATITHIYGETVLEKKPTTIVTVSWVNADTLLALGVVPAGMPTVTWGGNDNGSTDWIDAKLDELGAGWDTDKAPVTYDETDGINVDEMAALVPDLIVAAYSGITKEEYEQLSRIAPTIGPLAPNYTASWEDVLAAVGAATDLADEAAELAEKITGDLAAVGAENPAIEGATFIAGTLGLTDNTISLYVGEDTRPRFFTALGMTQADVVTENTEGEETFFIDWSPERADELDSDLFYSWAAPGTTVEDFRANPLFAQIPAVAAGGVVLTDDDHLTLSISAANALSLPWALENFVPTVVEVAQSVRG
ncbi:ABC transporter substrate-binding protein [Brachybacterium ginsengisoli]|uniref:ABC transporter substrate-binding protein n=1 Tax=Brachybacterium ginsengisoli TaxID=1331682 RepID=A0A291GUK1_9MICO|nr:ABC transporter substrate-binding protein [Brachybacterium ginsengisoli]ATG53903.1 ABC transporter substrate-binding protein [Brachybacterium ginsengisoli]